MRAAAACALDDDVVLWCHAITQQLCLTDTANQRLIAAAQRHIAIKNHQQQQEQAASIGEAWDAPAGAQHRHTDRAQSGGLMTSSDDNSNQHAQMATAQTTTQPNNIGTEVVGVQTQGASGGAGASTHAVPAGQSTAEASAGRRGDTSIAPQEATDGAALDDGGDAVGDEDDVAGIDDVLTGGVGDGDVFTHVGLGQDGEKVYAEQFDGTDGADSCQPAPSSQAAGCDQPLRVGQQPGTSQRPGISQQTGINQQGSCCQHASRSQQQCNGGPAVVALHGSLGLQQPCQQMQVSLQVAFCFTPYL